MTFWLKISITAIVFFALATIQQSFLPHVALFGVTANPVFVAFFISVFFEDPYDYYLGIFSAMFAGFLLDAFSLSYFGISIVSLLVVYGVTKLLLHFIKDTGQEYRLPYFIPLFLIAAVLFHIHVSISIAYETLLAILGFFLYKYIVGQQPKQLTLFR